MATVPLSGTDIRILSGVPFSNDYKNTRWFDTSTQQQNYFDSKPIVHSEAFHTFQRIEGQNFLSVKKSTDELWNASYIMFRNTEYNNKWFYAFVTKLQYVQKNHTHVHFQIDVLQTWRFEFGFHPSYVVREHCKLWETDGSPVINTVDEGLNYGTEMDTVEFTKFVPYGDVFFLVIVAKALLHDRADASANNIYPAINGSPQPLCYYVHPFKLDGTTPQTWDGADEIVLSSPLDILKAISTLDDAVNNVVSLYVTDYIGMNLDYTGGVLTMPPANFVNVNKHVTTVTPNVYFNTVYVTDIKNYQSKTTNLGSKWNGYASVAESKLLMHPYTQLILDDFKGNRTTFKNEYINNNNLEISVKGSLGTSNYTSYGIKDYNFSANNGLQMNASDEFALINSTPNDIPVITDMLSAYLQGNRNSLQNQKATIMFNGVMNGIGGVANTVTGATTGALGGSMLGPMGAITGAVAGGMSGALNTAQGAGNAVLQMQGLQAKQKDINNTPPSMAKMGSNTAYTVGNGYNGLFIIKKQIKPEYRKKLEDFFKMFGYKVNEVKIPNVHTRQSWNYVQTSACSIHGDFNHEDKQEIRNIFDGGITLWHTDDIGNYSLANGVI